MFCYFSLYILSQFHQIVKIFFLILHYKTYFSILSPSLLWKCVSLVCKSKYCHCFENVFYTLFHIQYCSCCGRVQCSSYIQTPRAQVNIAIDWQLDHGIDWLWSLCCALAACLVSCSMCLFSFEMQAAYYIEGRGGYCLVWGGTDSESESSPELALLHICRLF